MDDIKTLFEGVNAAVLELRAKVDAQAARPDGVTAAEIDKLNASITDMQAQLDAHAAAVAASKVGGGLPASSDEHRAMFRDLMAGKTGLQDVKARGTTFVGPDGGFIVPNQIDTNVGRILAQTTAMRGLANVIGISSNRYTMFKSLGGAAAAWEGEDVTTAETGSPTLAEINITPGKLTAEPVATVELVQDAAVDVEAWYAAELGASFGEKEGEAFITGSGVNRPRGLLGYTTVENSSYAWGSIGYINSTIDGGFPTAANGSGDPLVTLFYALRDAYRMRATWLMNDAVTGAVRKLKDTQGTFLWQPGLAADQPATVLGRPVRTDNYMPAAAEDSLSIAFGDFQQAYTIVDRIGINVLPNPYKQAGRIHYMTYKRVGGAVTNFEAVKLLRLGS